jgi:cobalt-zinc-cadmium efflux system membrane fusion protein
MKSIYRTTVLMAILLFACKGGAEKPEEKVPAALKEGQIRISQSQFESNDMALGNPTIMEFPEVIRVTGSIDVPPENRVVISAVYGGFVKKISLLEGDPVRKGQVVITLENPEFIQLQQGYLEVREQLPYLKSEYERQETLFEEQISSEKVFLKARSEYLTAMAQKKSLEAQLNLLGIQPGDLDAGKLRSVISLHTPISGKVNRVNVRTGAFVSPATEIMEIINNEHIHLELMVFEQDINRIQKGQTIRFRIPEISDRVREGAVYLIGNTVNENRTVKVHAHVREEDLKELMVGMFVQADILTGTTDSATGNLPSYWAVPEEAVISGESGSYILVLEASGEQGYTLRREPVEVGITSGGFTALKDPGTLDASDQVLTKGAFQAAGL